MMVLLLALVGLGSGVARADAPASSAASAASGDRESWRLWSWTGVEGLPDMSGESRLRAEEQLAVRADLDGGWNLDAMGSLRDRATGDPTGDLYRLSAGWQERSLRLQAGRSTRLSVDGFQHLDGLTIDRAHDSGDGFGLWAGRLWHPEQWDVGQTWVMGGEARLRRLGAVSFLGTAGLEGQVRDGSPGLRPHATASLRNPRGAYLAGLAQADLLAPGSRASLSGALPVGKLVDLGAVARWEDLVPAATPAALDQPVGWLAGPGYGVVSAEAVVKPGPFTVRASGGPTLRPGAPPAGAIGRASVAWSKDGLMVGLGSTAARIDDSWLAGVLAEARAPAGPVELQAQGGLFRFQGLRGPTADAWEARLGAGLPLASPREQLQDLKIVAQTAAGSDRVLQQWLRGGVVLQGSFGGGR